MDGLTHVVEDAALFCLARLEYLFFATQPVAGCRIISLTDCSVFSSKPALQAQAARAKKEAMMATLNRYSLRIYLLSFQVAEGQYIRHLIMYYVTIQLNMQLRN